MNKSRIETLKALVEMDPDNPLGRYGLANEYFKLENYEEAIIQINEYLRIKGDEGAVYRMLAECYLETGNKDRARVSYNKGIEAANRYGHPSMVEEFEEALEILDD